MRLLRSSGFDGNRDANPGQAHLELEISSFRTNWDICRPKSRSKTVLWRPSGLPHLSLQNIPNNMLFTGSRNSVLHSFTYYLLFGLLIVGHASASQAAIPASERAVLDAFYDQDGGAWWPWYVVWGGASGTECSWTGVTCSADESSIVGLSFYFWALSGPLPDLSPLTHLQIFDASQNRLTGAIPPISELHELTTFAVFTNQLSGSIPSLAGLTKLKVFEVGSNALTGEIPPLTDLSALQNFSAGNNLLTGNIPDLTGLDNLQRFEIGDNQISGTIPPLNGLSKLEQFYVSYNYLTGPVPALTGLSHLSNIFLDHNGLTGSMPDPPAPNMLAAGGSTLCPNGLTQSALAASKFNMGFCDEL